MYLASTTRPAVEVSAGADKVSPNVKAIGTVSLVTDVSTEMVASVLPLYLVIGLHLSPVAYGAIDGVYAGATALLRLAGGYVADRIQRRKLVAGAGYALSALAKLGLMAAGGSAPAISTAIAVDRAGKGLRTAPRDALITLSTPARSLGRAFGVHRMMDSAGAFTGPLVAIAVLAAAAHSFDAVFFVSFCVAAFGLVILALFVRDRREMQPAGPAISPAAIVHLWRDRPVRQLVLAASVLGFATIGDGFVYLLLQKRSDLAIGWFPVLAVGTNLAFLAMAAPLGRLADRIGRLPVIIAGYIGLVAVYALLYGPLAGWPLIGVALALYGFFYAASDGVLMALAGPVLPAATRTTGIALIQTGQAIAYVGSSVLFGLGWQLYGPAVASRLAAVMVVVAVGATALLLRRVPR